MLTPTVFLTAGHCTADATTARVYFQQDAGVNYDPATGIDPIMGYPETCASATLGVTCATSNELYNYGFDDFASFPNTRDVGLVILANPTVGIRLLGCGGLTRSAGYQTGTTGGDVYR